MPLSSLDTRFVAKLDASDVAPSTVQASSTENTGDSGATVNVASAELLRNIGIGFIAGLLLNLMPCVLPVIGLKIMSFASQAGEARGRVIALNLYFVAGLVSVFLALAALAAFLGMGWGEQFQRPEFSIVLASIVFVFALSFLGVWEIPIPGFVGSGKAMGAAQREGPIGAYLKGVLTTLLATPCSGPLIVPTLAWALNQPKPVIFATFASMGLGMGFPYLMISMFPRLINLLPKPGAWMDTFKQIMGFVLLATVVWIFSFLNADYFVPTLALLFSLWAACWWIGRTPLTAEASEKIKAYLSAGGFAALLGWFSFRLLLPGVEVDWSEYTPQALANLRDRNVTVLVDFTADW
jgi:thiol:disulfide interchange protein